MGAIAAFAKKRQESKGRPKHQYLLDHQDKFRKKVQQRKKNVYIFSQTSIGALFLGVVFILAGCFLTYALMSVDVAEDLTLWWRYLIIVGMISVGFLFILQVERNKIEIHKQHQLLMIEKSFPFQFCRKLTTVKDLKNLQNIRIVKRGHEAYSGSTLYYALEFAFKDSRHEVAEFHDLRSIKIKYTEIVTFIEQATDLGNIKVEDESTNYKTMKTQQNSKADTPVKPQKAQNQSTNSRPIDKRQVSDDQEETLNSVSQVDRKILDK